MHTTTRLATFLVSGALAAALLTGCSGGKDCAGQAYHPDLGQDGAKTPIQSLEAWLGTHQGLPQPPDTDWIVEDSGESHPTTVVIDNVDGDGWWVSAAQTADGGWVVSQATDNATACADKLS